MLLSLSLVHMHTAHILNFACYNWVVGLLEFTVNKCEELYKAVFLEVQQFCWVRNSNFMSEINFGEI